MSDVQPGQRNTSQSFPYGGLLGLTVGIAGDIALWIWLKSGPIVDGLARATRHHYSEDLDLAIFGL